MLPESMDELVYFTQRSLGKGEATVWVYKGKCPKCGVFMGKPKDRKGKVLVRAKEYACPQCGHAEEKAAYEGRLTASCLYACPQCGSKGETSALFRRSKIDGIDTLRFQCQKCNASIDITRKLKEKGSGKKGNAGADG